MIELHEDQHSGKYHIRSYEPGKIGINDTIYTNTLLVSVENLIEDWPPNTITELQPQHWQTVIDLKPVVVIIGTGPTLIFPDTELFAPLIAANIGYEVMDTAAACRTFRVLMSENRNALAVLFS